MSENDVRVEVLPVPEDSIVWCHNCVFAGDDDGAWGGGLVKALKRAIGHDRFLVLLTADDAVVDVIGEDEVVARVRAALNRVLCTFCGETVDVVDLDIPSDGPPYQRNLPCGHIVDREPA